MDTVINAQILKEVETSPNHKRPFVSIILPAHNESAILIQNLSILSNYLKSIEENYKWEIVIVNDGSTDNTGELAESFAANNKNVFIIHHKVNLYLGCALRTGIKHSRGDYIVVMDLDLSYSPDHIEKLLDSLIVTDSQVAIASPYMKGGKVTNVPFLRRVLSRVLNKFLAMVARENIHTFTGMVRAYEKNFIKNLNLKARDFEINPEIIYKSLLLRAKLVEVPSHLDWTLQKAAGKRRISNVRMIRGILSGFMSGFIFRPYFFFILVGFILGIISAYVIGWILINTINVYPTIPSMNGIFDDRFSAAVAEVFRQRPYAFVVGGITLVVALQFLSLGFLSLQSKRYFEELFHINTNILKTNRENSPNH